MATLVDTLENLDKRLTRIEQFLGFKTTHHTPGVERHYPVIRAQHKVKRKTTAQLNHKPKRQFVHKKHQWKHMRETILHLLSNRKRAISKNNLRSKLGITDKRALDWFLYDMKKKGQIQMPKQGYYLAA